MKCLLLMKSGLLMLSSVAILLASLYHILVVKTEVCDTDMRRYLMISDANIPMILYVVCMFIWVVSYSYGKVLYRRICSVEPTENIQG